jgi:hypothetical protein
LFWQKIEKKLEETKILNEKKLWLYNDLDFTLKYQTWLEKNANDEHSSLLPMYR